MKRSTVVAISIIFLSLTAGGVLGFYFYLNGKDKTNDQQFGRSAPTTGTFGSPSINTSVTLPGNASTTQPTQTPEVAQPVSSTTLPEIVIPALRHIYTEPVAGVAFFTKDIFATSSAITQSNTVVAGTSSTKTTTVVKPAQTKLIAKIEIIQLVDRASGHMYETATGTLELTKVSNTTVPKVYEASLLFRDRVLLRGLYNKTDIIETKYGVQKLLTPSSTEMTLITQDLTQGISQIALSPSKTKMFYLQTRAPLGMISNVDGTSAITAFESAYREWIAFWPTERTITLTTKASAFYPGYMYTLNTVTRAIQKVIGDTDGLTTLMSPNGGKVLYSKSESGAPNLYVLNTKDGSARNLFFRTFSEKCTWSVKEVDIVFCAVPQDIAFGDYPDAWYQGLIFFTDDIWKINTLTGETRLIAKLNDLSDQAIDVINPVLNPSETYMVFNNKIDLSLWGLKTVKDAPKATSTASLTFATTTATTNTRR